MRCLSVTYLLFILVNQFFEMHPIIHNIFYIHFFFCSYYRKRGSASYIVREVHSVRERDTERERERERRK